MVHACRFLATWGGRVDIDKETGLAVYKRPPGAPLGWSKLTPGLSFKETLLETGVTGSPQVRKGGKLMMITAVSYFIIQVSSARSHTHLYRLAYASFRHERKIVFFATRLAFDRTLHAVARRKGG